MRKLAAWTTCLIVAGLTLSSAAAAERAPAGGESRRKGPLAALPSKPGPHIEKIAALGDDSWLDLGAPAPDPVWGVGIGRAWSSKMAYAPDLRGAFLYGPGVHGGCTVRNGKKHYNDDLFFYDVNAHRWVCVYPGLEIGKYNAKANDDGFEVDEQGHPRPVACMVHAYQGVTYDTDRKMFAHLFNPSGGGYWEPLMPERVAFIKENSERLNGLGGTQLRCGMFPSRLNQASPWFYDTAEGHWRRQKTQTPTPAIGHGAHLIYLPPQKKFFFLGQGGTHLYDPEKNEWTKLSPAGQGPRKPIDAASCYDPKRERIYIAMGSYGVPEDIPGVENQVVAYDIAKNAWIDLQAKGQLPPRPEAVVGVNVSIMHYDSANDVVLYFALGRDINKSFETCGIYAYDAARSEWKLVTRALPETEIWKSGCNHCFYDPELNAHFIYKAGDSRAEGGMFVYRYKRAAK